VSDRHEILVVDDDEDTRLVLQDLLELNGFAVRACPDARHALEAARAAPPALMLVDYFMPDADGAWVVQQLRAAGLGRVPVVLRSLSTSTGCWSWSARWSPVPESRAFYAAPYASPPR
jgi:CheY-like chemotaxis protein